ncbi:MAG: magnesium chelatase subunit H [Pseudomonadota bacterium]
MPRPISADNTPIKVCLLTLDRHIAGAVEKARADLARDLPGLELSLHIASDWNDNEMAAEAARADIRRADLIIATMIFLEDHIKAIRPAILERREDCDAVLAAVSAGEIMKTTRLGRFRMDGPDKGPIALLKRLRGKSKEGRPSSGAKQMKMLRRLPKILRFIPGTAQDVRAYFLCMQYWLASTDQNLANMVRYLIDRYADGDRAHLRGALDVAPPEEFPDLGLYHPDMPGRVDDRIDRLPRHGRPQVGLLLMRSYILSGDTGHYDGVIRAMEAAGLDVIPAFASGLDGRPAIDAYFKENVQAVVSLTGFSLVGGPAYNDSPAAIEALQALDVPYLSAHALEFQTLEAWEGSTRGLMPIEATMMVALPEIDGATSPTVYGGRLAEGNASNACVAGAGAMVAHPERAETLAARVAKLVGLAETRRAERKLAVVLYNFPPNGGATGTAAYLSVFESLYNTLKSLGEAGYRVALPPTVEALRQAILGDQIVTEARIADRIPADTHVAREPYLAEIEEQWGPAPGKHQTDGRDIHVYGAHFGNVFVGIQPAFGYEGDPMRLLFEQGFAPTHAFAAFYRWLREDFAADVVIHFGTHGALEFMPGKQAGMSGGCWPDRLIGDLPNYYLYAANNPSEGMIAKRRSAATLISYLTPPVAHAGLYKGLAELKASLDRWRQMEAEDATRGDLAELIQTQAAAVDLAELEPVWDAKAHDQVAGLSAKIVELEYTLIPHGLHVIGAPAKAEERRDYLRAIGEGQGVALDDAAIDAALAGTADLPPELMEILLNADCLLAQDTETPALIAALDGRFIPPAPGGDLIRTPDILPTGRNLHGFDPFRLPSAFAMQDGAKQAGKLLERHLADSGALPETVALVLWGTDNLKTEGGPIAQALSLMGATPRFDGYGRLAGADLVPLDQLNRPRIDVVMTLSGIFRDLLPLQTRMLAEAAFKAATAEEPDAQNFIAKHARGYAALHKVSLEEAALRVFSNADGAYGSNVNLLIDSGAWADEDELADTFTTRKCFAYGLNGKPVKQEGLLQSTLAGVELAYQNLESVELGVTTVDHYFDTLGGIGRAVKKAKGDAIPVYIGDQTAGEGKVRTLSEQVDLEARTRVLNPKWYEAMLEHGHEGVRHIEAHVTNTMGWSATTGQVQPWVYQRISETFVLDEEMRRRLATLNPRASAKVANRLLEAHERNYWAPDDATLEALRQAGDELEDHVEGVSNWAAE